MASPQAEDSFSRTLQSWHVAVARNPRFRADVWQRIEGNTGVSLPWTAYVRTHVRVVVGALAVAVLLGAVVGREQARARVASDSTKMAVAYVQALDARRMHMP
jgi:hypothetical protein